MARVRCGECSKFVPNPEQTGTGKSALVGFGALAFFANQQGLTLIRETVSSAIEGTRTCEVALKDQPATNLHECINDFAFIPKL